MISVNWQPIGLILATALLIAITGCASTGESRDTETAYEPSDIEGGPIIDNLQVALWTDKTEWAHDETPTIKAELRVLGRGDYGYQDPPLGIYTVLDGLILVPRTARAPGGDASPQRSPIYGMEAQIDRSFVTLDRRRPLPRLAPGEHIIQLMVAAGPTDPKGGPYFMLMSNPVRIEVEDATGQ